MLMCVSFRQFDGNLTQHHALRRCFLVQLAGGESSQDWACRAGNCAGSWNQRAPTRIACFHVPALKCQTGAVEVLCTLDGVLAFTYV